MSAEDMEGRTISIDSKERLRGIARLSIYYRHDESTRLLRSLALAIGCKERGGYIFKPGGRQMNIGRGWGLFIENLLYLNLSADVLEAMVDEARRSKSVVALDSALVRDIKALKASAHQAL